jgi:hypothetical protein
MRLRPAVLSAAATLAGTLWAQQPPGPPIDLPINATFHRISENASRLSPMMEQVRVTDWVAKGAADTYLAQLASARQQLDAIVADMAALTRQPDQMQDCMKGLFRIQAFHRSLDSLMGGLRKYQNPALADLIQSVAAEDQADLEKLQTYILDLANLKEQAYLVVDREAQRCRADISRQPAAPVRNRRPN